MDEQDHPLRRSSDAVQDIILGQLNEHTKQIGAISDRMARYELSVEQLASAVKDGADALKLLTDELRSMRPAQDLYKDLMSVGRVLRWLVENTKVIVIAGAVVMVVLKSDTLVPLIIKALQ